MIEAIISEVLRSKVEGSLADELREAIIEAVNEMMIAIRRRCCPC